MVFVETSLFTKLLGEYLGDEDYRALQNHLIAQPGSGAIIKGSAASGRSAGLPAARVSQEG